MYRAIKNRPVPFLSKQDLVQNSGKILNQLFEFNNVFKYLIHVSRFVKRLVEWAVSLFTQIILNFELFVPNICFISYSFLWDTD